MTDQEKLKIAAQALEDSIGGQAACLRAVELTLEALQGAVPAGWRLVPIEPTEAMVSAMHDVIELPYNYANKAHKYQAKHTYAAMLAAAPQPAAQCTNSDTWNCKYCRKTESCEALKDPRNFASAAESHGCHGGDDSTLAAESQQEPAKGCLRCVTPKKCAVWGCVPGTFPTETSAQPTGRFAGLREALAQPTEPSGEPVAFVQSLDKPSPRCVTDLKYCTIAEHDNGDHLKYIPLYTRPAVQQEPAGEPVAHFGSAYVNENGVHITTVLGPVAIPQDAALYTRPAVPLSDEQKRQGYKAASEQYQGMGLMEFFLEGVSFAEREHKIGGAE
jgi:hypothetical protein